MGDAAGKPSKDDVKWALAQRLVHQRHRIEGKRPSMDRCDAECKRAIHILLWKPGEQS